MKRTAILARLIQFLVHRSTPIVAYAHVPGTLEVTPTVKSLAKKVPGHVTLVSLPSNAP